MLELIESTDKYNLTIRINSIVYANAIRRILISELPSLAVEQLEIKKNTSVLPDEVIAHRLALIPIFSENDGLCFVDQCLCKGLCDKCSIQFSLNIKSKDKTEVNAEDIRSEKDIFLVNSLINILENKQTLNIRGHIIKGIGNTHSKFTNVVVGYEYDINNKNRDTEYWKENDKTINEEWFIEQSTPDLINKDENVTLSIETQEGVFSANYSLKQSIKILKNKMEKLFINVKDVFN